MPLQAITATEPIPGYRIRERIGAGGYGEVWTADAPGGLLKAIKFVYGYLDEDRASRELKALNRIKSVRHPFLLSLERIEVVDGQLLIVTELAEASLKDRFEEVCKEGETGIEREELLRYMRDAADVLDYMCGEHSLQHLDIKPENILLLAGRVKVADFGLVKDIHDTTASLMGGLTPLYAPPEVFDGRPTLWSDQYSLAIVFQEMLTGELPFPGTTAVQLARQHLNARPRLSALPDRDQIVISRALAKTPTDRFKSCRELVEALETSDPVAVPSKGPGRAGGESGHSIGRQQSNGGKSQTEVVDAVPGTGDFLRESHRCRIPQVLRDPQVVSLPPVDVGESTIFGQPTLFLGLGGTAGHVLAQLRHRLEDRFGEGAAIPSLRMLLLDTDGKDLMNRARRAGNRGLAPEELMGIPLRRPQEYRRESRKLLQWLSRRWLYNIPKSLKTEGLRPLGRLAMVDHMEEIADRVRSGLSEAISDLSLSQSEETTQLAFRKDALQVIVVASISGGTGSGMLVDIAYLAQCLLQEMGLPADRVSGFLTHWTGRNPRSKELAAVNAYSTLAELNHFSRIGGHYPGDAACGLPAQNGDGPTFHDTYLLHLGDDLNDAQLAEAASDVAEYLYLDRVTNAATFFQECREHEPRNADSRNSEIRLRSFGLCRISCLRDDIISTAVEHFCRYAVERWSQGVNGHVDLPLQKTSPASLRKSTADESQSGQEQLESLAEEFAQSLNLNVDHLIKESFQCIEHELGGPATEFFQREIKQLDWGDHDGSAASIRCLSGNVTEFLDTLLGSCDSSDEAGKSESGTIEATVGAFRKQLATRYGRMIHARIMESVDDEQVRVRGAVWLTRWFHALCQEQSDQVAEVRVGIGNELQQAQQSLTALAESRGRHREASLKEQTSELYEQICRLRLYDYVTRSVRSVLLAIKGLVSGLQDEVMDLGRELRHLTGQFDDSRVLEELEFEEGAGSDQLLTSARDSLVSQVPTLTRELDERLKTTLLKKAGGLRNLLMLGGNERAKLPARVRVAARATIIDQMKQLDVSSVLFGEGETDDASEVEKLREYLRAAQPTLYTCGGSSRLLVMLPNGSSLVRPLEVLHSDLQQTPSVVENSDGDFIICQELERISLTQIAVGLIDGRSDFAEYASRLHTRTDVTWSELPDLE